MKKILVIPDPHDEPGVDQERFRWLGNMIVSELPDAIVHLGDGLSMDSLSSYDVGTLAAEGRRYDDDINSFHLSMNKIEAEVDQLNRTYSRQKKAKYTPRKVYCIGNHEQRIIKAVNQNPKFLGVLSLDQLKLVERGWEVYPLTEPAQVFGIAFAHYFTSGIMGRPISGINHARNLVARTYTSSVVGHSHDRSYWEDTDVFGNKVFGMVSGCYFTHELHYTHESDRNWAGIIILRVEEGQVNPDFYSINRVKELYS
jgi:predicted phosphodiesterase